MSAGIFFFCSLLHSQYLDTWQKLNKRMNEMVPWINLFPLGNCMNQFLLLLETYTRSLKTHLLTNVLVQFWTKVHASSIPPNPKYLEKNFLKVRCKTYCLDIHAACSNDNSALPIFFLHKSMCFRNWAIASNGVLCWKHSLQICKT